MTKLYQIVAELRAGPILAGSETPHRMAAEQQARIVSTGDGVRRVVVKEVARTVLQEFAAGEPVRQEMPTEQTRERESTRAGITHSPHPMAFSDNKSGFYDQNNQHVKAGDLIVRPMDGRRGRLDEALQDGDAFVTWDDGQHDTVKWRHLAKVEG